MKYSASLEFSQAHYLKLPKKIDFGVTLAAFSHDSPKISSFAT